jgi:hypothetical protein
MQRFIVERSDHLDDLQAAQNVMLSAYSNSKQNIVVAINYATSSKTIQVDIPGVKKIKGVKQYVTTADANDNMKPYPLQSLKNITLRPRSIVTIVVDK